MTLNGESTLAVSANTENNWGRSLGVKLGGAIGAALLVGSGGCAIHVTSGPSEQASASASPAASPAASSASPLFARRTYTEIADHNPVMQLWRDNKGTPADKTLALGEEVQVECLAPNLTAMASAEPGFYRIRLGNEVYYGISNMFANGDPVGANGYNTPVDPAVPPC